MFDGLRETNTEGNFNRQPHPSPYILMYLFIVLALLLEQCLHLKSFVAESGIFQGLLGLDGLQLPNNMHVPMAHCGPPALGTVH